MVWVTNDSPLTSGFTLDAKSSFPSESPVLLQPAVHPRPPSYKNVLLFVLLLLTSPSPAVVSATAVNDKQKCGWYHAAFIFKLCGFSDEDKLWVTLNECMEPFDAGHFS